MTIYVIISVVMLAVKLWSLYQARSSGGEPPPGQLDASKLPMLSDRPIPVVFGKVWISNPQVLWWSAAALPKGPPPEGDENTGQPWYNFRYPEGLNYFARLHLGVCLGRADILDVRVAGRRVSDAAFYDFSTRRPCVDISGGWLRITSEAVTPENRTQPEFPGLRGEFRILTGIGTDAFKPNWFRPFAPAGGAPDDAPDFRGITSLISCSSKNFDAGTFDPMSDNMRLIALEGDCWLGLESPDPPAMDLEVIRGSWGWDGTEQWYVDKVFVHRGSTWIGMNPAHIIREVLVSETFGIGVPTDRVDDAAFRAAADVLFSEKFGLNFAWETQISARDLIGDVLRHISALPWFDHASGLWSIKLIRADYVLGDARLVDEKTFGRVEKFTRTSWADLPNKTTATYRDPENDEEKQTTVTNTSTQIAAARVVGVTVDYKSVTDRELAERLAARDLVQMGSPLASVSLRCSPDAADIRPGQVIRWNSADHGTVGIALRVLQVNTGTGVDSEVALECVEDVFGSGYALYVPPDTPQNPYPDPTPVAPAERYAVPAPYWLAMQAGLPEPIVGGPTKADGAYGVYLAQRSQQLATSYHLEVSPDGVEPYERWRDNMLFTTRATLKAAASQGAKVLSIATTIVDNSTLPRGTLLMLSTGNPLTDELVVVVDVDAMAQTVRVERGVVDTVPHAWPIGTEAWAVTATSVLGEPIEVGSTAYAHALTVTRAGVLDPSDAATDMLGPMPERWRRLCPVGDLTIEDIGPTGPQSYPHDVVRGDLVVRWMHRHRAGSEALPLLPPQRWPAAEDEVRYVVTVDDGAGVVLYSFGVTSEFRGDTHTIPASAFAGHGRIRVAVAATIIDPGPVVRVGNWQSASAEFDVVG